MTRSAKRTDVRLSWKLSSEGERFVMRRTFDSGDVKHGLSSTVRPKPPPGPHSVFRVRVMVGGASGAGVNEWHSK